MQTKERKNTEISERISKLIDSLGVKPNAFAVALGYNRSQTIYDILNGKSAPSFDFFNKLALSEYSEIINMDWVLTGRGKILRNNNLRKEKESTLAEENILHTKIPENPYKENVGEIVGQKVGFRKFQKNPTNELDIREQDVPVYESMTLQSLDSLFSNTLKPNSYLSLPNLPKCDGAVRMWGDAMSPELQSGDLLVYKKVKDLRNGLFLGQIYLLSVEVEGEEYIMVQYVERSDISESVKLVSKNERYPPKDIPLDSIKAMAMIRASVRYRSI